MLSGQLVDQIHTRPGKASAFLADCHRCHGSADTLRVVAVDLRLVSSGIDFVQARRQLAHRIGRADHLLVMALRHGRTNRCDPAVAAHHRDKNQRMCRGVLYGVLRVAV